MDVTFYNLLLLTNLNIEMLTQSKIKTSCKTTQTNFRKICGGEYIYVCVSFFENEIFDLAAFYNTSCSIQKVQYSFLILPACFYRQNSFECAFFSFSWDA